MNDLSPTPVYTPFRIAGITRTEVLEAGIEVGFWQFLKSKVKASEKEEVKVDIEDPLAWLMDILGRLSQGGRHPVIVFEDYDKQLDPPEQPYDITMRVRDLISLDCTVIITGHPVGLTSAFDPKFDSSADIMRPFPLKPLSARQLSEMCRKYLAFVRTTEKPRSRTYPFTRKAVDSLASWVSGLRLTPRIFNNLCSDILDMAIRSSVIQINDKAVDNLLQESGKERIEALRQEDKDYLREVYKRGGIITEDYRDIIEAISGPEFGTYVDALTRVRPLQEREIIVPRLSPRRDLELQIDPRYEAIFLSEEADYHMGLKRLKDELTRLNLTQVYSDVLILEDKLNRVLRELADQGRTVIMSPDFSIIIRELNRIAREHLGIAFNSLCVES